MRRRFSFVLIMLMILAGSWIRPAFCQAEDAAWTVSMRRDWGYGMGSDRQGRMTLLLNGDLAKVTRVVYRMNGRIVADLSASPFHFSFNTNDYDSGITRIFAEVTTQDGTMVQTATVVFNFLSSDQANRTTYKLIGSIVALTLLLTIVSFAVASRKRENAGKSGGLLGIAVCKNCRQTFPRSFFGFNIVVGKYERCPHCGKWQVTLPATPQELAAADRENQPQSADPHPASSDEEELLEESRYSDL